jgi:hypothetical protein
MSSAEPDRPKAAWREDKKLSAAQQASRRSAQLEAHGRAIVALAALVGRQGGQSGAEVLRRITDSETALTVLDSVGYGARQLAETWQADQPSSPGPAQRRSSAWAGSPDHDERVTYALVHGASDAELAKIRAEVAAEYAGKAAEKAARDRDYYGLRPAAIGVSQGLDGAPLQRSAVRHDVPELGEA